ncbi:MAG: hypothetical protein P8Z42_15865 [Anaerolineales bacterium]
MPKMDVTFYDTFYFSADLSKVNGWWKESRLELMDTFSQIGAQKSPTTSAKPYVSKLLKVFPDGHTVAALLKKAKYVPDSVSLAAYSTDLRSDIAARGSSPSSKTIKNVRNLIELYHSLVMLTRQGPLPISIEGIAYFNTGDRKPTLTEHVNVFDALFGWDGGKYFAYSEDPPAFEVSECLPPSFAQLQEAVDYCRSGRSTNGLLVLNRSVWLKHLRALKSNPQHWKAIMADRFDGPHYSRLLDLLEYATEKDLDVIAIRRHDIGANLDDFD